MTWSKERILTLIKQYEVHECLWNVISEDYKNQNKKKEAWREISVHMEDNVEEIERKMRSILAQYRRERRRLANAKKCGNGVENLILPKWFAYNRLSFLNGINKLRKAKQALINKPCWGGVVKIEDEQDDTVNSQYEEPDEDVQHIIQQSQSFDIQQPGPSRTLSKRKIDDLDKKVNKAYTIINSILHKQKSNKEYRDEYAAFGEVVASKIRKLSTTYEKNVVQFKINTLLFQAEMGEFKAPALLNNNTPTQDDSPLAFVSDSTTYAVAPAIADN